MDQSHTTNPPPDAPSAPTPPMEGPSPTTVADRLTGAFATLQTELEALRSAQGTHDERAALLDHRERAMMEHATQLGEREYDLAQRHRELNEAQQRLVEEAGAWRTREIALETRRRRLAKQRALLAERAAQLIRAKETLAQRLADTNRMRTDLTQTTAARALPAPAPAPRTVIRRRGSLSNAAAAWSLFLAATLGTSWIIAGEIDTPTHLARCVLAMEGHEKQPDDATLESWTQYVESLPGDPMLLDRFADALKRRGYPELGNPIDAKRFLESSMEQEQSAPGTVALAIIGPGKQRSERILDALCAAMVGMANDTRGQRLDQRATKIHSASRAEMDPIRSNRVQQAGMIGGGLIVLGVIVGAGIARVVGSAIGIKGSGQSGPTDSEESRWEV